jgi:hypothetical protein
MTIYRVVVCCGYGRLADEAASHLRTEHGDISARDRSRIAREVRQLPAVVRNQAGLEGFAFPDASTQAIALLQPARTDGLRCMACPFVCRVKQTMQAHCQTQHGWVNDWKRGGNVRQRAKEVRAVPWTTGV